MFQLVSFQSVYVFETNSLSLSQNLFDRDWKIENKFSLQSAILNLKIES